jgi:hypothetical protein
MQPEPTVLQRDGGAKLTGARFYGAILIRAYFANAEGLDSADLAGTDFTVTNLTGATWSCRNRHPVTASLSRWLLDATHA